MSVRATSLASLVAVAARLPLAAPAAAGVPRRIRRRQRLSPVASEVRLGGDDGADPPGGRFRARRSTCAPSRWPIPIGWSSTCRRSRSSSRPRPARSGRGLIKAFRFGLVMHGRLAHRDRSRASGPRRQSLRARCRQRPAGAPGARPRRRSTARRSCAPSRSRAARRSAAAPSPSSHQPDERSAPDDRDRSRPWRHRQRHQGARAARWKRRSCSNSRCCCATRSKRPANTAWP